MGQDRPSLGPVTANILPLEPLKSHPGRRRGLSCPLRTTVPACARSVLGQPGCPGPEDPETQRGEQSLSGTGPGLELWASSPFSPRLHNCPPPLPGPLLLPLPLPGLFIGPGSVASRRRGARAPRLELTGPSPGWAGSAFSPAKGHVTQSEQGRWGGQATAGGWARTWARAPLESFAVHRQAGLPQKCPGDSLGLGRISEVYKGTSPSLGRPGVRRPTRGPTRLPPPLEAPRVSFL